MATLHEEIQALISAAQRNTTVTDSVLAYITAQAQDLTDIRNKMAASGVSDQDLADLDAYTKAVSDNSDRIANAVVASTPVAGEATA